MWERALDLPPCEDTYEALANRFHYHLKMAGLSRKEHNFYYITSQDTPSSIPFGPYHVYLDSLRSGFNVGNILRTTEALRFGTIHFSPTTPYIDNKKVKDAAMGCERLVPTTQNATLASLPRPLIAIETSPDAVPYNEFEFPQEATLLLGNEEYGLSSASLSAADHLVSIPLIGQKNSLNVANAFAIIASHITRLGAHVH